MNLKNCKYCDEEFDWKEKTRSRGGYANVCADCHDERPDPDANTPVIKGFAGGEGEELQILSFRNSDEAEDFLQEIEQKNQE